MWCGDGVWCGVVCMHFDFFYWIGRAMIDSGVARKDIFITSKLAQCGGGAYTIALLAPPL